MKNVLRFFLVVMVCAVMASACGTVGKNFDTSRIKDIKNQVTTKSEILDWFGLPFKEGTENGSLMWTYQFDKYLAGTTESRDLVILFNEKNQVKAFRYSSNT